jgi:nitrate reductase gamma subunit
MPALPLGEAGKYVAVAYVVLLALLGIYIAIMARRLSRTERRMSELDDHLRERRS